MYAMTAAHPTLPIPSYARIRNPANGREVLVRVNDRGPFVAGRIVDLSYAAAFKLDLLRGVAPVELERITFDDIRTGAWRGGGGVATRLARGAALGDPTAWRRSPVAGAVAARRSTCRRRAVRDRARPRRPALAAVARRRPPLPPPAPTCDRRAADARPRSAARRPKRRAASGSSSAPFASATAPRPSAAASAPTASRRGSSRCWRSSATRRCYRVQAGPYPSRDEAEAPAQRARGALGVVPVVVERR